MMSESDSESKKSSPLEESYDSENEEKVIIYQFLYCDMDPIPEEWFLPLSGGARGCKNASQCTKFEIFIDGSTTDQSATYKKKHLRRGGIGVFHPDSGTRISRPFPLPNPTNNRCEYFAAIFALEWVLRVTSRLSLEEQAQLEVVLFTDSQLLLNSMTLWLPGWKRRGWKKSDGQPVKNQGLLEKLDQLITNRLPKTTWKKVKAHQKKPPSSDGYKCWLWQGNYIADELASDGRVMAERLNPPVNSEKTTSRKKSKSKFRSRSRSKGKKINPTKKKMKSPGRYFRKKN